MTRWLQRHPHRAALVFLALLPATLLWPSLFGNNTYVPYDLAQFPPVSTMLTEAEYAETVREDNTDITEIPVMFGPQLRFIRSQLHQGRIAHWDPYSRSGAPMWASSILGVTYPPNWPLFFGLDPYQGFVFAAYLAFVIASGLMYGFLVQLGLGPLPALFGAIAFAYSGTLTINAHFYQRINALIWLPGILWAIQSASRQQGTRRIPAVLCLSLCMFLTMTAGFPPFALVVSFLAAAFAGCLLVGQWRRAGPRPALVSAAVVGGGAVLGVSAAAVQLLPMAEFFPVSNRDIQVSGNSIAYIGFNWYGLLGYLMPDLLGHPHLNEAGKLPDMFSPLAWYLQTGTRWEEQATATGTLPPGSYFQPNYNFCEYTVFVGVVTVVLALAGALHPRPGFRRFALGALLVLVLLATAGPWMSWLLGLSPFRWVPPMRYMGPTCMFMAALAAMGLEALPRLRPWTILAVGIAGLAAAAACFGWRAWVAAHTETEILEAMLPTLQAKYSPELGDITLEEARQYLGPSMPVAREQMLDGLAYAGWLLLGGSLALLGLPWIARLRHGVRALQVLALVVLLAELLSFGIPLNRGRELKHSHRTAIHDFLVEQRERYGPQGGFTVMRASARCEPVIQRQLPGGTLLNDRIRDLNAYTFVDRQSHKPILELYGPRYLSRLYWPVALPDDERLQRPYFDLLGVRYVLAEEPLEHAGRRVGPECKGPRGEFFVYERDTALPNAFVVPAFRTVSGEEAVVEALVAEDFAPGSYCLLDPRTAAEVPALADNAGASDRGVVFEPVDNPNVLHLEVAAGEPGYLVINLTAMPGWSATVNGEPAPIHTANLFLSMIPLGPEAAEVRLSYITPGFRKGLWITLSSFCLMAALVLFHRLQHRSRPPSRPASRPPSGPASRPARDYDETPF